MGIGLKNRLTELEEKKSQMENRRFIEKIWEEMKIQMETGGTSDYIGKLNKRKKPMFSMGKGNKWRKET